MKTAEMVLKKVSVSLCDDEDTSVLAFIRDSAHSHATGVTKELLQQPSFTELPLSLAIKRYIFLTIIGRSCNKYHFCCDISFVVTNTCLSPQTRVCGNETRLLPRQKYACCNKTFVVTRLCLLRQKFCCDKYLL